jgi:Domain of unknown function (DUF6285)
MPTNLSPAPDLLAIVREFLESDILRDPGLTDEKRFNVRVAVNLLATAEREVRFGPAANAAEEDRLSALVGAEGSLEEKNRRLARAIREGAIAGDRLLDHLRRTTVDALRINNPKWLDVG